MFLKVIHINSIIETIVFDLDETLIHSTHEKLGYFDIKLDLMMPDIDKSKVLKLIKLLGLCQFKTICY